MDLVKLDGGSWRRMTLACARCSFFRRSEPTNTKFRWTFVTISQTKYCCNIYQSLDIVRRVLGCLSTSGALVAAVLAELAFRNNLVNYYTEPGIKITLL